MNTFLTSMNDDVYTAAVETGKQLDEKRRFKQIVEGMQLLILSCRLREPENPLWNMAPFKGMGLVTFKRTPIMARHPAFRMWEHSQRALDDYIRGIADTWSGNTTNYEQREMLQLYVDYEQTNPPWWRTGMRELFVNDCKRNLTRKDPSHYKYGVEPKEGYFFPYDQVR